MGVRNALSGFEAFKQGRTGPTGKVDSNKRKEARSLEQNGGCLVQINK